ncbi:hypothetical protein DPX16_17330 [Anabarilius grahami]|uniref:Uncharacterized protein n=1 Tax=Anabarilius grahami TaxID=495550 RepID=A0A3N0XYP1_ANAGA|nr:hypothetical protein DPX16_17330 [Anabarilius grahami]
MGAEHTKAVVKGTVCMQCEHLPLMTLCSLLAMFIESGQAHAPHGLGPRSAKVAQRLRLWRSQLELVEELEAASALSRPSSTSSSALARDSEAHSAASSTPSESLMLARSSSEEVDILSIKVGNVEDSPPPSLTYRSSWGLCSCCSRIKCHMASCEAGGTQENYLDECFLQSTASRSKACLFFNDLHTEAEMTARNKASHTNLLCFYHVLIRHSSPAQQLHIVML